MSTPQLREAISALDRKILNDPLNTAERYEQMRVMQREAGLLHGERPICPFLRPHIMSASDYRETSRGAALVAEALDRLVSEALKDATLTDELGVTPTELAFARVDPGYSRHCVTTRLDTYLTNEGFSFLEYNGESPAGIGDQLVLERMLFDLPLVREFLDAHPAVRIDPCRKLLDSLLATYDEWGGREATPRIAIVDWKGVPTAPEFEILRRYFEATGTPTIVVDPGELEYEHGILSARGQRIDVLYKRVIIHEFLERSQPGHALTRAYHEGRVCIVNSFRSKIAHKKASFAVLSDPRFEHQLTPEQLDAVQRHVPWTRRVGERDVDYAGSRLPMRDLLLEEKDRLVLKPNDSYGGHSVAIGYDTDPADWQRAIDLAFREPFVVQQLVEVQSVSIPRYVEGDVRADEMTVDFDPYLFNGEVEGALVRLSSTTLSNISSGGTETALLVVED